MNTQPFLTTDMMYVCMYRGCPFVELPMATGGPTGPRGESQPRGTIDTALPTLDHTHAFNVRFLNQLYSRQLRVSCILMYSDTPGPTTDMSFGAKSY